MKPATKLPVRVREGYGSILHLEASPVGSGDPDLKPIADLNFHGVWGKEQNRQNADYIAHAANAYPKLVTALREIGAMTVGRSRIDANRLDERIKSILREVDELGMES